MAKIVLQSQDGIISRLRKTLNAMFTELYTLIETMATNTQNLPQFTGTIYYVSPDGDNTATGLNPQVPLETIGAAVGKLSAGDAVTVGAGTYTEVGLDLNVAYCELWFEIGSVIDPATGTALTISGNYCKVKGSHTVTPAALATGTLVTGNFCEVADGRVLAGGTGLRIEGQGAVVNNCACGNQTAIGYDLRGAQARLRACSTVGVGASYGYFINNEVDTGVLEDCTSVGHATSGFHISTLSTNWTLLNCSSGAGDGRWVDVDNANVWSNFTYADEVTKGVAHASAGTTFNLFKVTGSVRLSELSGHVETQLENTACTFQIVLWSANNSAAITTASANAANAVVGSVFIRNAPSDDALDFGNPSGTPVTIENTSWKDPKAAIDIVAENGEDTYVRLITSADLASGATHWHAHWEPIDETGFLEAV